MSTGESRPITEIDAMKELVGGLQAIRVVMAQMERRATHAIWYANPMERKYATKCVMEAVSAFYEALSKCPKKPTGGTGGGTGGGGTGPDCGQGYHEEYGNCVKDPPGGG